MASISLRGVVKRYGQQPAVRGISLEIEDGEFVSLLGPSGCGKTTTLRMIAGLESPDEGEIAIGGRTVAAPARGVDVPTEARALGMVFQSYAVWPHKTVEANVAYPLVVAGRPRAEVEERTRRALAAVRMETLAARYPSQLSGGQQQRVALARALCADPSVLLLDEPLSNLDAHLRAEMRSEIRALHDRLGVTVVYVTHDQAEALALSDRIAVFAEGTLRQAGPPEQVYGAPADAFVAGFVGGANLLPGRVARSGAAEVEGLGEVACDTAPGLEGPCTVAVRPEHVSLAAEGFPAIVEARQFLGDRVELALRAGSHGLRTYVPAASAPRVGEAVRLSFSAARALKGR